MTIQHIADASPGWYCLIYAGNQEYHKVPVAAWGICAEQNDKGVIERIPRPLCAIPSTQLTPVSEDTIPGFFGIISDEQEIQCASIAEDLLKSWLNAPENQELSQKLDAIAEE